jgi:small subunit ribosomal protein S16
VVAKKRPYYKIVVADSRARATASILEQVGTYNPLLAKDDENRVRLVEDRARTGWASARSRPTASPAARQGRHQGTRRHVNPNKGEPGKKAKERAEEKAEKKPLPRSKPPVKPKKLPRPLLLRPSCRRSSGRGSSGRQNRLKAKSWVRTGPSRSPPSPARTA